MNKLNNKIREKLFVSNINDTTILDVCKLYEGKGF